MDKFLWDNEKIDVLIDFENHLEEFKPSDHSFTKEDGK